MDNVAKYRKQIPESLLQRVDFVDGVLVWSDAKYKARNGKRAGGLKPQGQYRVIKYEGHAYYVHRVVYAKHHGHCPENIDHINGDKFDNRIENLRAVEHYENIWNSGARSNSKTGAKGVTKTKEGRYLAAIKALGQRFYLGTFDNIEAASNAYMSKARELHKEFARV